MVDLQPVPVDCAKYFTWREAPDLQRIIGALEVATQQCAMFVGGCVRDSFLGQPPQVNDTHNPTDIDIATTLSPDETIASLEKANIRAIPTGYDHGTITAVAGKVTAEITSLRADIDTDGRHAVVQFTEDWTQDWRRRDFTINAIYLTSDGRLYDPANGTADLKAQRVLFIGDAEKRIEEDFLRILRFYRFSARFAKSMDRVGTGACVKLRAGLQQISAERISHEFLRILGGPNLPRVLKVMKDDGVLTEIVPTNIELDMVDALFALTAEQGARSAELFLAALWTESDSTFKKLRLSNKQAKRIQAAVLASNWLLQHSGEDHHAKELLYRHGIEAYRDGLLLAWASDQSTTSKRRLPDARWQELLRIPGLWTPPSNPFSGRDFHSLGVQDGPQMGRILKEAEQLWIDANYSTDPTEIENIRQQAMRLFD